MRQFKWALLGCLSLFSISFISCKGNLASGEQAEVSQQARGLRIVSIQGFNSGRNEFNNNFAQAGEYVVLWGNFPIDAADSYASSIGEVVFESVDQINLKLPLNLSGTHEFRVMNRSGSSNAVPFDIKANDVALADGYDLIGTPCLAASDCAGIPGAKPSLCKLHTSTGNLQYEGGFCTRRCLRDDDCGGEGMCLYGKGPLGEAENICVPKCVQSADCRENGYVCHNFGTASEPKGGCWIDGHAPVDAGPSARDDLTGAPCTADSQCQAPATGFCLREASGFPGGFCTADCSLSLSDAFCGAGAACVLQVAPSPVPGEDPYIVGKCEKTCSAFDLYPEGCREGYGCTALFPSPPLTGFCAPRCDSPASLGCAPGTVCRNGGCVDQSEIEDFDGGQQTPIEDGGHGHGDGGRVVFCPDGGDYPTFGDGGSNVPYLDGGDIDEDNSNMPHIDGGHSDAGG